MKRTKEFRRHQRERKVAKAYRALKTWKCEHRSDEELHKVSKKMADNMKVNQCQCCCNPRRSNLFGKKEKLTIQELKTPTVEEELEEDLD